MKGDFLIANPIIKTWAQLYDRLGRQAISKLRDYRIMYKDTNGNMIPIKLVYNETGNNWWFEEIK